jgi:hypothetical protein
VSFGTVVTKKAWKFILENVLPSNKDRKTTKNSTQVKSDYTEGKGPIGLV